MINLKKYGLTNDLIIQNEAFYGTEENTTSEFCFARISEVHKNIYKAVCPYGEIHATLKGSLMHDFQYTNDFPCVGDFVLIKHNSSGVSIIHKVLERKSKFSRTNFSGHAAGYVKNVLEQLVATNFDYVFIMSSLNYDFNLKRIERYITASWQSGALPVIILTKADLCNDCAEKIKQVQKIAKNIDVISISNKTKEGFSNLNEYLKPTKTIVFLGSSGVGKSSLVNALAEKEIMQVNQIREDDSKGRHTTTHRQLIKLDSGVIIIDTPGMRELGIWDGSGGVSETFEDIESLFSKCKFSDCKHNSEPNCAVKEALESGELSHERWNNYLTQKNEISFVNDKTKYLQNKKQWHKRISKEIKNIKSTL